MDQGHRFVWLAERPLGSDRTRRPMMGGKRPRLFFSEETWLQDRLRSHMPVEEGRPKYHGCDAGECSIVGLLRLQVLSAWHGDSTHWTEEANALREYLEDPTDCYVVRVIEAFSFASPLSRDRMRSVKNENAKLRCAPEGGIVHACNLDAATLSLHNGNLTTDQTDRLPVTVAEVCHRWDLPLDELAKLRTHVQPKPIAQLVLEGRWHDLVWLARWRSPFPAQPENLDLDELRQASYEAIDLANTSAFSEIRALLRDLQRWLPKILQATEAGEVERERQRLDAHCTFLAQLERHFKPSRRHAGKKNESLVSAHLLASTLCNMRDVAQASKHGADLLFGGSFAEATAWRANEVISPEYLRSRLVCFDMATVLAERKEVYSAAHGGCVRWAWGDSSPYGGFDWYQHKEQWCRDANLLSLVNAVDSLILANKSQTPLNQQDTDKAHAVIEGSLHVRMGQPMAKGEGASSAEHLAACMAQGVYLVSETPEDFDRILDEHVSYTGDLGADVALRSFQVESPQDVLPSWLRHRAVPLVADVEVANDVPMGAALVAEVDENQDPFVEVRMQDGAVPRESPKLRALLQNAMDISGQLHILSNLPKDIEKRCAAGQLILRCSRL